MIITFVSAFLNHHQTQLCDEIKKYCDEFYFVSTMPMPDARRDLGYKDSESEHDFVIRAYDGSTPESRIEEILLCSDVVIFGDCDNKYINLRMKENKLSFLYSERFFKKGTWRRFIPTTRKTIKERVVNHKNKNFYVLCASAFLSYDLKLMGFNPDKCYKWGYFPEDSSCDEYAQRNNRKLKILWAGRFIDWKHPDHALRAVASLKNKGYDFTLNFIGRGEMEDELKVLSSSLGIAENVRFLGSMSPEEVQEYMKESDIFLVTSDYKEGWGAVVNEAMGAGSAVLASSALGSVPFLINDGQNGIIYRYGDMTDFEEKLEILTVDKELRKKFGKAAVATIKNEYNCEVAVKRLMEFIGNGCEDMGYKSGPMSKAVVTKNKWYEK